MSDIQTEITRSSQQVDLTLRIAVSFFLFTSVLAFTLVLSKFYVLPEFTQVELSGSVRDLQEMKEYQTTLKAQLLQHEQERNALILPAQDPIYKTLKEQKLQQMDYAGLLEDLMLMAKEFTAVDEQPVHIDSIHFLNELGAIEMQGDIRNVGPRSMTVLARFVQELEALEFVDALQHPQYIREFDPARDGPYSPFTIRFLLKTDV